VLFLLIKLCAVKGAPLFTFLGLVYVVSWFSVELLLVVLQQKNLTEDQVDAILSLRNTVARFERLKSWGSAFWTFASFCLFLGVFLYGAFKTKLGVEIVSMIATFGTMFLPILVASKAFPVIFNGPSSCVLFF
jgi:hypothetical protein